MSEPRRKAASLPPDAPVEIVQVSRTHRQLPRDEEVALIRLAQAGDKRARDKVVRHALSWVVAQAFRVKRGTLRLEDIVQEGTLGILRALEPPPRGYDPDSGNRFGTYVNWWIRAYIGKYLERARSAVVPRAGVVAQVDISLDAPLSDEDDVTRLDFLADEAPAADEVLDLAWRDQQVRRVIATSRKRLGPLAIDLVWNRLAGEDTLLEVGVRHGVSRERVRQVEKDVLPFLQRRLEVFRGDLASARKGAPEPRSLGAGLGAGRGKGKEFCRVVGCTNRLGFKNKRGVCGQCQAKGYRKDRAKPLDEPVRAGGVGRLPRHACDLTITTPKDEEKAA